MFRFLMAACPMLSWVFDFPVFKLPLATADGDTIFFIYREMLSIWEDLVRVQGYFRFENKLI